MSQADYLEEYISTMETRDGEETSDVHAQLAQKERDLILAAELGKALLEKNEKLSRENELMAESYSKHLEELAQEKHSLTRKMSVMESEYEAQLMQLQTDLQNMRLEIESEHDSGKSVAKERSRMISELTEQNQRLTRQLRDAIKNEEHLNMQLQHMRNQQDVRCSDISEHASHLEVMRDEVSLLTEQRQELERRVLSLGEERQRLSARLEESTDRVLCLERENRMQSSQITQQRREMAELASTNSQLTERLEGGAGGALCVTHSSASTTYTSLQTELDLSADEGIGSGSHNLSVPLAPHKQSLSSGRGDEDPEDVEEEEEEGVECDTLQLQVPVTDGQQLRELRQEVYDLLLQLRALNERLRPSERHNVNSLDTDSSEDLPLHKVKAGMLQEVFGELQSRVHDLLRPRKGACEHCGRQSQMQLEIELHSAQERCDQLDKRLAHQTDTMKRQAEELMRYMQELLMKDKQYKALKEERDILKNDLSNTHLSKEELIRKAWETRDQAVQRKNATEVELAKSRIDVMQINSQLLESIQQKVELSCQLDQWQSDMQQLLEDQIRRKLTQTEGGSDSDSSASGANGSSTRQKKSILGIFSRTS